MNRRGPAAVGAVALVLAIGLVAWQSGHPTAPAATDAQGRQPTRVEPPRGASSPSPVPATASPPRPRAPAAVHMPFDPTAAWAFTSPPLRPGEVEFCGLGTAAAESPAARALEQQARAQTEQAGERLFAVMLRSADPRTRAAAQMARDERDALADAARLTADPTVYAMATQACNRGGTQPRSASCGALSAQQMARIDPDNVIPWLHVAGEAVQRKDAGGAAEALYRASLANTSRVREFAFADLALSALPADWPALDAMRASAKVLEIHASLALPAYLRRSSTARRTEWPTRTCSRPAIAWRAC